jgi:hypothetical protein
MAQRFATVHPDRQAPAAWVAYIDNHDQAYVWVPELDRFAFNDAITNDLAWHHELHLRAISPLKARELCDDRTIGRIDDPADRWLLDDLADAPALAADRILPESTPPRTRSQQVEDALNLLKENPGEYVIYGSYAAEDQSKAVRAASDLRNGRVAAFAKILPGYSPGVRVLPTADKSHYVIMVRGTVLAASDGDDELDRASRIRPGKSGSAARRYAKKWRAGVRPVKAWPADRPLVDELVGLRVKAKARTTGTGAKSRVIVVKKSMVGQTLRDIASKQKPSKASKKSLSRISR